MRTSGTNNSGFSIVAIVVLLVCIGIVVVVGVRVYEAATRSHPDITAPVSTTSIAAFKGVSFTPKSFSVDSLRSFYTEASQLGGVSWAGQWNDLGPAGNIIKTARQYNITPVVIIGTHTGVASGSPKSTLTTKEAFVGALRDFARTNKPPYMGIGNEVNLLQAEAPKEYAQFVEWFADAAAAIKQVSPDTKMFTVFQYERLRGLGGGLFGGVNDESKAEWALFKDFPAADLLAFTTYPYLIYRTPNGIPKTYYSDIAAHTTKPYAFTEVGWPSEQEAAGYAGTPEQQVEFIQTFANLTKAKMAFALWAFMYDPSTPPPFNSDGLKNTNGAKPSLKAWQDLRPVWY